MSFKDILVHCDGGERDALRIGMAAGVAKRFGARLTGLFGRVEHHSPAMVARRASDAFLAATAASEQVFAALAAAAGIRGRWWSLSHGETGHVLSETAAAARFADLVVVGQHHEGKDAPEDLIETLILEAGRPVLIVPSVGDYPTIGSNVLLAWNAGREAARALHDAMPFLESAAQVDVLTIRGTRTAPASDGQLPPLSIHDYLSAHGIRVNREVLAGDDIGVMDLILSRAFDQGADLLVMGAHGGYQLPFFKGAGTRHILRHMTLPVLMSH
ncbi:MAG: universal stress protein [Magnetospirillum sp.]|nr:universal stress protein [Magnetospirillum sp.]